MDTIFAFISPFVEFFDLHYQTGFFTTLFILITAGMVINHLETIGKGDSFDIEFSLIVFVTSLVLAFVWPIIIVLAAVAATGYFYYWITGVLVSLALRRFTKK